MKKHVRALLFSLLPLAIILTLVVNALQTPASGKVQAASLSNVPLMFVPNRGQWDASIQFKAYGLGGALSFEQDRVALYLHPSENKAARQNRGQDLLQRLETRRVTTPPSVLTWQFEGANPKPEVTALETLPTVFHYYLGNMPENWVTQVPASRQIKYHNLYPGIDLLYEEAEGRLKSTYLVAPGSNPQQIRWHYAGAESIQYDESTGDLRMTLSSEASEEKIVLRERAPLVWQEIGDQPTTVEARMVLGADESLHFELDAYDPHYPLIIDPVLEFESFISVGFSAEITGIAVDEEGNSYLSGTYYDTENSNPEEQPALLAKLDAFGMPSFILTYGGNNYTYANDLALGTAIYDGVQSVYLTGETLATDLPALYAYQSEYGGGMDAFVVRFSRGGALLGSTYLGGTGGESGLGIAVNQNGRPTVTGLAGGSDFPLLNEVQACGSVDAFVTKFESTGNALVFSTCLGGSGSDVGYDVALDTLGVPYIVGETTSSNFPTVNAAQGSYAGNIDIFVTKLSFSGNSIHFSTYLGGASVDGFPRIAVDASGNALVTAETISTSFPTTQDALQPSCAVDANGCIDDVFTKFSSSGSLLYATFWGGIDIEDEPAIAVDSDGYIYLTGSTSSFDFPLLNSLKPSNPISMCDSFLSKFTPDGTSLVYSTLLGRENACDYLSNIAVDASKIAYLAGTSWRAGTGGEDIYVAKVSDSFSAPPSPSPTGQIPTATPPGPTPTNWIPTSTPVPPTATKTPTPTPTSTHTPTPTATPIGPLTVEILDANGTPVSTLTKNQDGWYTPNPLTVQITVANTQLEELNGTLDFVFGSPNSSTRFYVVNAPDACSFASDWPYTNQTYIGSCNVLIFPGEPPQTFTWEVWIQPSTDGLFDVNAELLVNGNPIATDADEVDLPQAAINPVIFIHGILGSMPPGQHLWTSRPTPLDIQIPTEPVLDPFLESYYPMVDHLEKMGYEWGVTLFALAYDWRDDNDESGTFLGNSIVNVVLPSASQLPYIASNPQVDLVVHSMGGLVSRACAQNENSNCHGNVRKIIFMASPHQGFASDYRTREGLTWGDYFEHEVPGGADLWVTMQPFMDFLLWPRMIRLQYNPTSQEIEEDCSPSFPLGSYDCSIAHYAWAHDPVRGIVSLSQMLPTTDLLDENYITNIFDQQESWPCTAGVKPSDLENHWLEALNANISQLVTEVGEENIYVLYSEEFGNLTDRQYPSICVIHPYNQWPYGWPITQVEVPADFGDDLIPVESTTLRRSGLLPIPLANETVIDLFGHKGIAYALDAQKKVTEYLTGGQISSGTTPYHAPNALANLLRIVAVFVETDSGENLGESGNANLPVQIMITDPGGQQFGYDPVSEAMIPGIPGAFYSGSEEPQFMVLFNTLPGDYQITVTGMSNSNYEMETYSIDEHGLQLMNVFTGTVTTGQVITHTAEYTVSSETLFFDDMESGGSNWLAEGGWGLDASSSNSPVTSWASGVITTNVPQTLTLGIPLDLSTASVASLTFWHTYTLSSQAQALVEVSTDGGITWQTVVTYQNETHDWTPLVMSLTPFTGPEYAPLQLRFRLLSTHPGDQWRIDDVRVETIAPPTVFELPFEDDVESWRKWEGEEGWTRTHTLYTSPDTAWQSSTPGASLTLAGNLDLQMAVTPALTFWYSMTVGGAGVVEILPAGESTWQTVETLTETTGWTQAEVDLSPWTGVTATLRLRQTGQPGAVWTVDDFLVQEVTLPVIHPLPFADDMESPTANWQAINAWEPVTTTAHSGTTAWVGEASGSAVMLVDQLDLSNTTSPVLSFWQQFDLPTGTVGQVRVRSETDLIWQPVLTVTNPISGWTPINVDLSAYAGEKVELAFVVDDAPVGEEGQTSQTTPGLPPVAVGLSFLAIVVLGVAQITNEPKHRSRLQKMFNIGVWIGIVWACLYFSGVLWSIPFYRAWRINHLNVVEGGKVETLVSASQKPASAYLSPGGSWMLVTQREGTSGISDYRLLLDLATGETRSILLENTTHLRWLDDDLFIGEQSQHGFFMVHVPDLEKTYLTEHEISAESDELFALQHSEKLYAIEESGGYNFVDLTGDMPSIYIISTLLSFDEHKQLLEKFPNAKVISREYRTVVEEKLGATALIRHLRIYSPDGSLYAENSPGSSPFLQIFSTQGDVLLARVQKRGYSPTLLGWSADGRGFYFELLTGGLGEVLAPERPVFLLRLDDTGSNITGVKVGSEMQSGFASVVPVSYTLSPAQLNLAPGWYIDDVSVFDAQPTPTPTDTPTATPTSTNTPTATPTHTLTPTPSPTPTSTPSPTPTNTPTGTTTNTPTPTNTPSDLIFADGFESGNFSAWSSYTSSSDLTVTGNAAIQGNYGLLNVVNDNGLLYVEDTSPNAETSYRARFYLDPNSIQMNTGTHGVFLASGEPVGSTTSAVLVLLGKSTGETDYKIRVAARQDNGNWLYSLNYPISDAPHALEIYWQAATAPGANNGIIQLWLDGDSKYLQTALDNDTFHIDTARLGVVRGLDIETVGSHCLDAFESRRTTYIGLLSGSADCPGGGGMAPEGFNPLSSGSKSPTLLQPGDILFADSFESGDYTAWDYHSSDPDLSVGTTAALSGTYGLSIQVDDSRPVYVRDDTPNAATQYSARFYLDPNGLWLNGGNHTIFLGKMNPNTDVLAVDLGHQPDTGEYQIMLRLKDEDGEWMLTPGFTITDAPHAIEVHWGTASGPGAHDGWAELWLDGVLVYEHTQLANAGLVLDNVRLGAVYAPLPGATGVYCLDEFVSASGAYIGTLDGVSGCGEGGTEGPEGQAPVPPAIIPSAPRKWPYE